MGLFCASVECLKPFDIDKCPHTMYISVAFTRTISSRLKIRKKLPYGHGTKEKRLEFNRKYRIRILVGAKAVGRLFCPFGEAKDWSGSTQVKTRHWVEETPTQTLLTVNEK
ncbi:hypothetical protein Pfo_013399 [Paulownia fortunei]|nr:hypothetical protein Pfo_013399 [Paulownia fortunei]